MSGFIKMLSDETGFVQKPAEKESFRNDSGAAISKGDWVVIDVSVTTLGLGAHIETSPATADNPACIGVANEDIPDGAVGEVVVRGPVKDANVLTGTAAGVCIQTIATAGRAGVAGAATERSLGFTMELAADNKADVYIY
jgi:hypothetical protein